MSSVIGSLRVNLGLDSAQFAKGAKAAGVSSKTLQKQIVAVGAVAASVGAALTTLTIATSKTAVEIKNFSQIAKSTPAELQKWAAGAKTVGIEQEKLGDILKDVNDRVGDFLTTGGGPMADFFENIAPKIGITADAFRDLSGPQALQLYVDSLQKAGLSQQEMTFYLEAMASDTTALIPLLRDGGAEMKRLGDNAASLGGIMKDSTVASLAGLRAALDDAGTAVRGIGFRISGELAPALTTLVTSFNDSMREGGLLRGVIDGMIGTISTLGDIAATVSQSFDILAISIGTLALMRIPALLAGVNSVSIALVASQGVIYATATASAALALAMNAIPFVAIVTGITAIVRLGGAIKDSRASAAEMSAAMGDMIGSLARLDAASNAYYSNVTRGNYMAAKAAADFTKAQAEEALQAARNHLAAQERISNVLYLGLAESEGVRNARAAVLDMGNALLDAEARVSAFGYSAEKMNILFGDAIPIVDGLTTSLKGYTASTFTAIPAAAELNARYGAMAETMRGVLEAQNALAAGDASAGISKLLTDISGVSDKLGLGVDQAGDFQQALANIGSMDTFQAQAQAMAGLASHLLDANGDLSSMNAETRRVYQSLLDAADGAAIMGQQVAIAEANTTALGAAIAKIAPQFAPAIVAANALATAVGNVLAKLGGVASGLLNLSRTASAVADATGGAVGFLKDLGGTAVGAASAALASVAGNLKSVWSESTKSGASVASLNKHLKDLVSPSSGGGGGGGAAKLSADAKEAAKQLREAERAAEQLKSALDRPMITVIDGMANAFGDLVASGMRDFKNFGKAILSSITSAISQAVAFAIANPIKVAFGLSGGLTGSPAVAGQAGGAGGGILGGLGGLTKTFIGGFGGGGGIAGLAGGTGLLGGAGNVIGGFASGGFGGAMSGLTGSLAGATSGLAGLGAAVGAIAVPLLAVAAVFSFFKKKVKLLDGGIRVTTEGMDALIETFKDEEIKRFWGLSKKRRVTYTEADADVADPIMDIIAKMQGGVLDLAGALGVGRSAFADFSHQIQVSTKDMSEEEAQQAIAEALAGVGNAFADLVPNMAQFTREGEESTDTLSRIVSDLGSVNQVMDTLGHTLMDVSVIGAGTASNFAVLFGGIDAMNTATTAFYMGFYSEAERFATATRQIEAQFAALNIAMPATRAQFRAMVDALDLTTVGGRETYAALVSMSGALDAILPAVASLTVALAGMIGSVTTEIDAMIGTTSEAMRANEQAASLWYRTASTLRAFIADMRGTAGALISGGQARAFSEARFQTLLASAIGGDNQAAGDLTTAARTLLDNTRATARSSLEVARAEARVLADLQLASGVSDVEGARHDVVAGLLGQQVDLLGTVRDAINSGNPLEPSDIAGLNGQLGALEGAIKAAEMINYAYLKERLQVSVDLIADADIPASLRTLLDNAATGITGTIDFLVRSDLTPDQKFLALNSSSEHIKTVDLVTGALLDPNTAWVAVRTNSTLTKTVDLKSGKLLDLNTAWVAMTTASKLDKTVNLLNGKMLEPNTAFVAVNTASSLNKTVNLLNGKMLDLNTAWVALNTVSKLDKTVNLLAGAKLPSELMTLALSGSSELSRTVNAALAADMDQEAKRLALGNIGDYTVAIRAGFSLPHVDAAARRVLFSQAGSYTAMMRAAFDLPNVDAAARRVLFHQQGGYIANITGILATDMSAATRNLLLETNTLGARAVTIATVFAKDLTVEEREALQASGANVLRTIKAAVNPLGLSPTGLLFLRQLADGGEVTRTIDGDISFANLTASEHRFLWAENGSLTRVMRSFVSFTNGLSESGHRFLWADSGSVSRVMNSYVSFKNGITPTAHRFLWAENDTITRIINGYVDVSKLTGQQAALLGAINGQTDGRITLGGSFSFDPAGGFQTWFSSSTQANITAPMSGLRVSLDALRAELQANADAEAARAALAQRVGAANEAASGLSRDAAGNVLTTMAGLAGVARAAGVSTNQAPAAVASQVAGLSATDGISGFNIVGSMTDYLFNQLRSGKVAVDGADYQRIYSDIQAAGSGYKNDPAGHYRDHGLSEILNGSRGFVPQAFDWSSVGITIPGFATGGTHMGGLRMVGENGPELEVTGPSRIYSAPQTQAMMGGNNAEVVKELRELRKELSDLKRQAGAFDAEKVRFARKNNTLLERQQAREEGVL